MAFVTCSKLIEVLIDQLNQATQEQRDRLCEALGCCAGGAPTPAPQCTPAAVVEATSPYDVVHEGETISVDSRGGYPLTFSAVGSEGQSVLWEFANGETSTEPSLSVPVGATELPCGLTTTVTLTSFCEPGQQGASDSATLSVTVTCG